jgi:hypothetical protein
MQLSLTDNQIRALFKHNCVGVHQSWPSSANGSKSPHSSWVGSTDCTSWPYLQRIHMWCYMSVWLHWPSPITNPFQGLHLNFHVGTVNWDVYMQQGISSVRAICTLFAIVLIGGIDGGLYIQVYHVVMIYSWLSRVAWPLQTKISWGHSNKNNLFLVTYCLFEYPYVLAVYVKELAGVILHSCTQNQKHALLL